MAKRISRASVPSPKRNPAIPGGVPDRAVEIGDVVLRLLHTADWHLGRRFPSFPEEAQKKLSRARMDVIATILDVARRRAVHAVLCAGDIFDAGVISGLLETGDPVSAAIRGTAAASLYISRASSRFATIHDWQSVAPEVTVRHH